MRKNIGNLLLEAKVIDQDQLMKVLRHQNRFGGRLASTCLTLGFADERILSTVLSYQLGLPFLVLSASGFPLDALALIPIQAAQKLHSLPICRRQKELVVALTEPRNIAVLDELRFTTGAKIIEYGALESPLLDTIETTYRIRQDRSAEWYYGTEFVRPAQLDPCGHLVLVKAQTLQIEQQNLSQPRVFLPDNLDAILTLPQNDESTPMDQLGARSILVVEDEPLLLNMYSEYLRKLDYEVWQAGDGNQAMQMLQKRLPGAVVTDAMLPGVHGFEICRRLKSSASTRHIPVIIISAVYRGWRYAEDVRRLYGADHFLEKPVRLDQLKHLLQQCLDQSDSAASDQDNLSSQAKSALMEAAKAYQAGDLIGSAKHLEAALSTSPFTASLHYRLGLLYEKLQDSYRAIAALERAVELAENYDSLLSLARLYEKAGFTLKAFEAWERCLRHCSDPEEAERLRAHLKTLQH